MAQPTQDRDAVESLNIEVEGESQAPRKVELDLDDAPFLQVEEPPPPAVEEHDTPPPPEENKGKRKKLFIFGGAFLGALIAGGAAVWWFFFRGAPPPPPTTPDPEVVVVPSRQTPSGPQDIVHEFAVFVVPVNDDPSQTHFLICKFAAITQDAEVDQEMGRQQIPLRDAVYYYLRGKDANWLQDAHNYDAIKKDLMAVFNDYLSRGKLEDIVFESYLSR